MEVLPGNTIPSSQIPKSSKKQLKLGPGLTHTPPSIISATIAGELNIDNRKNAIWIESYSNGGRV
jgi:exosome complex component RRP40